MAEMIVLGVVVGLLVHETLGLTPGGIIVPGFLAIYILQPPVVISTLLVSLLAYGSVMLLNRCLLLYGRRKFAAYILAGLIFKLLVAQIPPLGVTFWGADSLGYIIPGLIAREMEAQNPFITWGLLLFTALLVRVIYDLTVSVL